jgi:hypothetical protein
MSTTLGSPLLAIILAALPAHGHVYAERPGHWVLVQSEFDYLPAQPRITLRVDRMTPKEFVDALARESRLTIALQGELPSAPLLSVSFRDADPKEAFQWLAERLPVVFMAKPPNTLLIFVNGKRG